MPKIRALNSPNREGTSPEAEKTGLFQRKAVKGWREEVAQKITGCKELSEHCCGQGSLLLGNRRAEDRTLV